MSRYKLKLLTFTLLFLLVAVAVPGVLQAQGAVDITLTTTNPTVQEGDTFDVTVGLSSNAQDINGAAIYLSFDPAVLQVVPDGLTIPTSNLPVPLVAPVVDEINGTIDYAAGNFTQDVEANFDLLTITFEAVAAGETTLAFDTESTTPTKVDLNGTDVTGQVDSLTITVEGPEPFLVCINAGGGALTAFGRDFLAADAGGNSTSNADFSYTGASKYTTGAGVANTDADALFNTERYGGKPANNGTPQPMTWDINVPVSGNYDLDLYFAEAFTEAVGARIFDIEAEGSLILDDFRPGDLAAVLNSNDGDSSNDGTAGKLYALPTLTFDDINVTDGVLSLIFNASTDNGKISALCVRDSDGETNAAPVVDDLVDTSVAQGDILSVEVTATDADDTDLTLQGVVLSSTGSGSSAQATMYPVTFDGTSFQWDSTGIATGSYTAVAMASDDQQQFDGTFFEVTVTEPVVVNQPPEAAITIDNNGSSDTIESATPFIFELSGTGSSDDNGITSYAWNTGETTETINVEVAPGTSEEITLTVTDADNETDTATVTLTVTEPVVVNQPPEAAITIDNNGGSDTIESATPFIFELSGTGSSDDNGITSYAWNTGETTETIDVEVAPGASEEITLTVTDADNETDTATVTLTVTKPEPEPFLVCINAGGAQVDAFGRTFLAAGASGTSTTNVTFAYTGASKYTINGGVENTDADALFNTERYGGENSAMTWNVNVPASGNYDLDLYFAEAFTEAVGARVFDVEAEESLILDDFRPGDLAAVLNSNDGDGNNDGTAGKLYALPALTFDDINVTDGALSLVINASEDNGKISALCVRDSDGETNAAPVVDGITAASVAQGETLDVEVTATDADDSILTLQGVVLSSTGTGNNAQATMYPVTFDGTTFQFDSTGIALGTYTGVVMASDDQQQFGIAFFDITVTEPAIPTLTFNPDVLPFSVEVDQSDNASFAVDVSDSTTPALTFEVSTGDDWLTITNDDTANVDANGLAAGDYDATVTVSADGYEGDTLAVNLTVTEPLVSAPPEAVITITNNNGSDTVESDVIFTFELSGAGSSDDIAVTNYTWDGATVDVNDAALATVDVQPGQSQEVTLTVVDGDGQEDTAIVTLTVTQPVVVNPNDILFRVNAGGPEITAIDDGPNWSADTSGDPSEYLTNAGSENTDTWPVDSVNPSVPNYVPSTIFGTERWDNTNDAAGEMQWSFDVPDGDYIVNLYMMNGWNGTSDPDQRVFDVAVEGNIPAVLDNIDLSSEFGHQVGGLKSTEVSVTDGALTLDFLHISQKNNPTINGIEIIVAEPVVVNNPPTITTNPDDTEYVSISETDTLDFDVNLDDADVDDTLTLSVTATDSDNNDVSSSVTTALNGNSGRLYIATLAPLTGSGPTVYTLTFTVDDGTTTAQTVVDVNVTEPRSLTVLSPTDGETIVGDSVTVQWESTGGDTTPRMGSTDGDHIHLRLNEEIGNFDQRVAIYDELSGSYTFEVATSELVYGLNELEVVMAAPMHNEYVNDTRQLLTFTLVEPTLPTLTFNPDVLNFSLETGQTDSDTFAVDISDSTTPTLTFEVSAGDEWLTISNDDTANVDATGLAAGDYDATVTVSAAGYESDTLTVNLTVTEPVVQEDLQFTINPPTVAIDEGQQFDVTVEVAVGSEPILGAGIWLTYDPALLQIVEVSEVDDPVLSLSLANNVNNTTGDFEYDAGSFTSVTGTFDLVTLTFQALAPSNPTTDIAFDLNQTSATAGISGVPYQATGVEVTINDIILDVAPVIEAVDDVTVVEGETAQAVISASDVDDVDDDITLDVTIDGVDTNDYTVTDNNDGTWTVSWLTATGDAANSPYLATVTATDGTNDADDVTFQINVLEPGAVVLAVDKQAPAFINFGEQMTYIIDITSTGEALSIPAEDVVLTDALPAGAEFVSVTPATCQEADGTITCALADLAAGDSETVEIVVDVTQATETQTVSFPVNPFTLIYNVTIPVSNVISVEPDGLCTINPDDVECSVTVEANTSQSLVLTRLADEQPTELVNTAVVDASNAATAEDTVTTIIGEAPALVITPDTMDFTATEGDTTTQNAGITISTDDNSALPGDLTLEAIDDATQAAATWLTVTETDVTVDPSGLAVGTYTATVTASGGGVTDATMTVSLTVEPAVVVQSGIAEIAITPNGGLGASTFGNNSLQITNNSPDASSAGAQIKSVSIDLSTGILPDMVFDPVGTGGDATAVCFTANGGAAATGLVAPQDPCVDPFTQPRNGGFDVITVDFTEFDPGESLLFKTDVDPNNIQGVPGAGNAGAVSGYELIGATVTVTFVEAGQEYTVTSNLFEDGSLGGGVATVAAETPAAPAIELVNYPTTPVTVNDPNQTVSITGEPNSDVTLLMMDSRLYIASGEPPFDVSAEELPYYANEAMSGQLITTVTLDANGEATVPVSLFLTPGASGTPDGGINRILTMTDNGVQNGLTSNLLVVKYDPNFVPPALDLTVDPTELEIEEGTTETTSGTYTVTESNGNLPLDLTVTSDAAWLTVNGDGTYTVDASTLTPGQYIATLTASAATYKDATATVTLTVTPAATDTDGAALVEINPGGGLFASTFGNNSYQITNDGLQDITSVSIDLSTAIFPDIVFDPVGDAGDSGAKCLTTGNAGNTAAEVGLTVPGNNGNDASDPDCSTPFSNANEGGFYTVTLDFTDFQPGEAYFFGLDVDPTSIQGDQSTGDAGSISGLELSGATVTVTFADGATLTTSMFGDGSNGGSSALAAVGAPVAPTLAVNGVPTTPALVGEANQTILVTGVPNSTVTLLHVDARLYIDAGGGGFDVEAFEANEALLVDYIPVTLDANGTASVPVTLLQTLSPNAGPDAGINHFIAVTDGDPNSQTSNLIVLEYDPAAVNTPPVIEAIPNSSVVAGETSTTTITVTDLDADPVTVGATVIDQDSNLIPATLTDNLDGTWTLEIPTAEADAGDVYTVEITATDDENAPVSTTFTVSVNAPTDNNPSVTVTIKDGQNGWNDVSTFGADSFIVTNNGDVNLTALSFDVSGAFMPDVIFDPLGTGGDTIGKCFDANSGAGAVGLLTSEGGSVNVNNPACVPPVYSIPNDGIADDGYFGLNIEFNDFEPNETFGFSADMDPGSIKGDTTAGGSGGISGLEMIPGIVTATFADGTVITAPIWLDEDQSDAGGRAVLALNAPTTPPSISIDGLSTPTTINGENQTVLVTGPANAPFTLLQVDARLHIDSGSANGNWPEGYDIEPFEANESVNKVVFTGTLDANGNASVPVTLLATEPPYVIGPDGGLNHFIAVINGTNGQTSPASNVIVVEYIPGENLPPVVTNPGNQTDNAGEAITPLQIVATPPETDQTLTYEADGLPNGLSIDPATGLITGTPQNVGGTGAFVEQDGLIVIEMESADTLPGAWEDINSYSTTFSPNVNNPTAATGDNFIIWQAGQSLGNPGNGLIEYQVQITNPGTYQFNWRNQVGNGTNTTEHNDTWLKIQADAFYGSQNGGASIVCPKGFDASENDCSGGAPNGSGSNGWFKVYSSGANNWSWSTNTSDNDAHQIFARFDAPGVYTIQISARSSSHAIDRLYLRRTGPNGPTVGQSAAQNLGNAESPRSTGSVGTQVYNVTVTATDNASDPLSTSVSFDWTIGSDVVTDNDPVISVQGANPTTVNLGETYIDAGATAFDTEDGDLTSVIQISGDVVDTNTVGSYTIIYTVTDSDQNTAQATRTVNVIDPTAGPAVIAFTLVDATTDQDLFVITEGQQIDLTALPNPVNIRADVNDNSIDSVTFALSGAEIQNQTESVVPYALFGDNNGDYNPWTPSLGSYSLTATPDVGTALTQTFSFVEGVVDNVAPTATLGADATITDSDGLAGEEVTLDGTGSTDSDGTIVSYNWTVNGSPLAETTATVTLTLPDGDNDITLTVTDDDGATSANTATQTITVEAPVIVDEVPVADAGVDITVTDNDNNGTESVTLDGTASTDDNGIVSYTWTSSPAVNIPDGAQPTADFPVGTTTVTLTVTDASNQTDTDTMTVTVEAPVIVDEVPVADAGVDITVTDNDNNGTESVTLDGTASTDDSGIVSYVWMSDPVVNIPNVAQPTADFPVGTYTVTLTVADASNQTDTDTMTVIVEEGDVITPTCGGLSQQAENGTLAGDFVVGNDGAASGGQYIHVPTDTGSVTPAPNGSTATYCFDIPATGTYLLEAQVWADAGDNNSFFVQVNGGILNLWDTPQPTNGNYVTDVVNNRGGGDPVEFNLSAGETEVVVHLREDGTRLDSLTFVPVNVVTDNAPTANAGTDITVTDNDNNGVESVTLDGTASTDDNGIVSYVWTSSPAVNIPDGAQPTADFPVGTTTVTLTVTDASNQTDTDTMTVTVEAPVIDDAPTANAGTDITVTDNDNNGVESVTLDGTASTDDNGIVSYVWTSSPAVNISDGAQPTADFPVGTTTVTLTVTDASNQTDTDTMTVTVEEGDVVVNPTCGSLTQEAEDGDSSGMLIINDGSYSGNTALQSPGDTGPFYGSVNTNAPQVTYCFTVTQTGTYQLQASVFGPGNDFDSFYVAFEGDIYLWDFPQTNTYVSNAVVTNRGGGTAEATLQPGEYEVTFYMREQQSILDNVRLFAVDTTPENQAPFATIQVPDGQTVESATPVTFDLNANFSTDPDGAIVNYEWSNGDTGLTTSVTVQPGTAQTITLTVTDNDGATDQISVTLTVNVPVAASCGALTQEAENGDLTGFDVSTADGYTFISTSEGPFYGGPNDDHMATYCFTVTQAGTYQLQASVFGPDDDFDSFWVEFQGTTYLWDFPGDPGIYVNNAVVTNRGGGTAEVTLQPGDYEVTFYQREIDSRLDNVSLVLVGGSGAALTPTGLGVSGATTDVQPSLSWQATNTDTAAWFNIVLLDGADNVVLDQWVDAATSCLSAECQFDMADGLAAGNYKLWMRAWEDDVFSEWVEGPTFDVQAPTISVPTDLRTMNGIYYWQAAEGAEWYEVWIGESAAGNATGHTQWYSAEDLGCADGGVCQITPEMADVNGELIWYVRAYGAGMFSTGGVDGWTQGPAHTGGMSEFPGR